MENDDGPKDPKDAERSDIDRDEILARRRRLVTSALAGIAMSSCDKLPRPFVCLSPVVPAARVDAGAPTVEANPNPCLAVAIDQPEDASVDAAASDADATAVDAEADARAARTDARRTPERARERIPRTTAPPRACLLMMMTMKGDGDNDD